MVQIAACIETLFEELPFTERILQIGKLGLPAIEFWLWDTEEKDIQAIGQVARENGITISSFLANCPDGTIGGSLVDPGDRQICLERLEEAIRIAGILGCSSVITCSGNSIIHWTKEEQQQNIVNVLREAVPMAEEAEVTLLLEPLNSLIDHQGYFLDSSKVGFEIIRQVNSKNVRLLYDIYHMQIMEGNILNTIEQNLELIGHFHAAGVPGRHELGIGELNYANIFEKIRALGYRGTFGLEYYPTLPSADSVMKCLEAIGWRKENQRYFRDH